MATDTAAPVIPASAAVQTLPPPSGSGVPLRKHIPGSQMPGKMNESVDKILKDQARKTGVVVSTDERATTPDAAAPTETVPASPPPQINEAPRVPEPTKAPEEKPKGFIVDSKGARRSSGEPMDAPKAKEPSASAAPEVKITGLADLLKSGVTSTPDAKTEVPTADELDREEKELVATGQLSERTAKKFERNSTFRRALEKERDELRAKLAEKEKTTASAPALSDEDKQLIEEGRASRWLNDPETMAEVTGRYSPVIARHNDAIYNLLKGYGQNDDALKIIKDEGGWVKLASSPHYAAQAKALYDWLPVGAQQQLNAHVTAIVTAEEEKQSFIGQGKANAAKLMAERQQQHQTRDGQNNQQREANKKQIDDWLKYDLTKHALFKKVEIPADAPKDTKQRLQGEIDAQNYLLGQAAKVFEGDLSVTAEMMVAVANGLHMQILAPQVIAQKDSEIADLKRRLDAATNGVPGASRPSPTRREDVTEPTKPKNLQLPDVRRGESKIKTGMDAAVANLLAQNARQ